MTRFLTVSALALTLATPALAEEFVLDEIVVTANLIPTEQDRTGVTLSVVRDEDLRAAGDAPVARTLDRLPGVSVAGNGGFGTTTSLRIRGADDRYIAVFVDGVLVSDPSGTQVGYDFGSAITSDIGRIEVLHGSQSALYGGSAVGGVINIQTRRAMTEGRSQSFAAELGSRGTRAASYNYAEKRGGFDHAFTLSHLHTDGISAASTGAEADGAETTRLSYSAQYQVSDALTLGGAAFHQRGWADYDGYDPATYAPADAINRSHRNELGGRLFAEYAAGNTIHLFEITGYRSKRQYDEAGTLSDFKGSRFGLAWRATTEMSPALTLVYGADTTREMSRASSIRGGSADTRVSGLFAQGLWTPRAGVDVSASLRRDHNSDFGGFTTARLAVAAKLNPATTLRAAIGTGFRAPSLSERYADYGWFVGNPDLKPEESISAEAGIDYELAGRGRVSATLFQLKTDELITYSTAIYPNTLFNVPGTSTRRGLELSGEWALSDAVTLSGSYTYLDAKDANGARLARIPRHDLSLGIKAEFGDTTARADLRHGSGIVDQGELPSYTVLDAQVSHDFGAGAQGYLRVENLFDRDYEVIRGYNTPERSVYVGIRKNF